jgi:transketolase
MVIFSTGSMVYNALMVANKLEQIGLSVRVIDFNTIKPLDCDAIHSCLKMKLLVSLEEHSIIGGLGTSISEYMSSVKHSTTLLRLGVKDCFSKPGDYNYLLKQNRLSIDEIFEDILTKLNELTEL